ncbi:transcription/translation regulatory transformer protein RfaH [Corallincola platygyrae]|uniref:Transcription/translation regulatory transformer protein RfaH n=1 Tax=Corallincola platygyrae TaxID=1193278 RepID=A0ABW4XGY0_9GAMM
MQSSKLERWFLLKCKPRQEQRAVANLEQQLIEAYAPQIDVSKIKRGKRTTETEPLFPGYLFARFDPHFVSLTSVQSTRGVSAVVRFGQQLAEVSDQAIRDIKDKCCNQDAPEVSADLPSKGDKVHLTDGSLKGLEAVYQMDDGEQRAFVLIDLLGKQQRVSVEQGHIRKSL